MRSGDRIYVSQRYIAWMDMARLPGEGSGGGGLMRGIWRLQGSGEALDFVILVNGMAPNHLFPGQDYALRGNGMTTAGDGFEILLGTRNSQTEDPRETYRASSGDVEPGEHFGWCNGLHCFKASGRMKQTTPVGSNTLLNARFEPSGSGWTVGINGPSETYALYNAIYLFEYNTIRVQHWIVMRGTDSYPIQTLVFSFNLSQTDCYSVPDLRLTDLTSDEPGIGTLSGGPQFYTEPRCPDASNMYLQQSTNYLHPNAPYGQPGWTQARNITAQSRTFTSTGGYGGTRMTFEGSRVYARANVQYWPHGPTPIWHQYIHNSGDMAIMTYDVKVGNNNYNAPLGKLNDREIVFHGMKLHL
jgi:hypothetical protein